MTFWQLHNFYSFLLGLQNYLCQKKKKKDSLLGSSLKFLNIIITVPGTELDPMYCNGIHGSAARKGSIQLCYCGWLPPAPPFKQDYSFILYFLKLRVSASNRKQQKTLFFFSLSTRKAIILLHQIFLTNRQEKEEISGMFLYIMLTEKSALIFLPSLLLHTNTHK